MLSKTKWQTGQHSGARNNASKIVSGVPWPSTQSEHMGVMLNNALKMMPVTTLDQIPF